jgi:hydrogenase expression/formation protein HypC
MSRLRRVVLCDCDSEALVEDVEGHGEGVSLLALDGPPPRPGEWLVVHSGYAIGRMDEESARATLADLEIVQGPAREGGS